MTKKYHDMVFLYGAKVGPIVEFTENEITVTWPEVGKSYSADRRKIVPIISEWTELDGAYYSMGKAIFEHFMKKEVE